MKYEIQTFTICDGWVNTDGSQYDTMYEAEDELADFFEDVETAFFNGWLSDKYDRDDYRIVEVV